MAVIYDLVAPTLGSPCSPQRAPRLFQQFKVFPLGVFRAFHLPQLNFLLLYGDNVSCKINSVSEKISVAYQMLSPQNCKRVFRRCDHFGRWRRRALS